MLDAARLRKHGINTVVVVWDIFEQAAGALARSQGVGDLPLVVVPQVAPGESEEDQRAKAVPATAAIIEAWRA